MAAERGDVVKEIVKLATKKTPAGNTQYNKARDRLDSALLAIKKSGNDKEKNRFFKDLEAALKREGKSLSLILKGDAVELSTHDLVYDAFGEAMEPTYYWILDFLRDALAYKVEKTSDFFAASEASGYYGEMGQRRTAMESRLAGDRGLFGTINLIVKSIINLLFDLKTFDIRLKNYDDLKSKDPGIKRTAIDALKGTWLNEVDKSKGNAAIDTLATQLNFITLRDAFMLVPIQEWCTYDADSKKISETKEKADRYVRGMDLTDVVRRILAPRTKEFIDWMYISDKELRKRRDIEKAYLKAQNSALKAYAKWARPYLIGTNKLIPAEYTELLEEHKELGLGPESIPTPFHAMWFYLELMGQKAAKIELTRPPVGVYKELELEDKSNRPFTIIDVRFAFRGSPQQAAGARGQPGMAFTGRTFIRFSGYVMLEKHWKLLLEKQDDEVLNFIDVMTKETLDAMADDLQKYLEEAPEPETKPAKTIFDLPLSQFVKPIFGSLKKFNEQAQAIYKHMPRVGLSSSEAWKLARLKLVAQEKAKKDSQSIFDKYRKANKMLNPP